MNPQSCPPRSEAHPGLAAKPSVGHQVGHAWLSPKQETLEVQYVVSTEVNGNSTILKLDRHHVTLILGPCGSQL